MKRILLFLFLLTASSAFATDRYALTTGGTGSGTCTTIGTPCTVAYMLTQLTAGDIGYFCATDCDGADSGTYTGWFNDSIPSGTSFANAVTLKPYPGETITLQPSAGAERVFNFYGNDTHYIIISGFVMDCVNVSNDCVKVADSGGTYADHIRIQSNEIKNAVGNGVLLTGPSPAGSAGGFNEILSNNIHDNATFDFMPFGHGIYVTSKSNLIDGNTIHDHSSDTAHNSLGVHIYNGGSGGLNDNVVRNNTIYNNTKGGCILVADGSNIQVYNNVCYGNYSGITAFSGLTAALIYNNTCYSNTIHGVESKGGSATLFTNNILYMNGTNLLNTSGSYTSTTNLIGTNPFFTNAAGNDFTLTASSTAAIDQGTSVASVLTTDILGTARPSGLAFDIGAYEYVSGSAPPATSSIQFDSACTGQGSGASITFTCTVGDNPNRAAVLFVATGTATATTISASDFNGDSFGASICTADENTGGIDAIVDAFVLNAPDVGTHTVTVTLSDAAGGSAAAMMSFYAINQSVSHGTAVGATGNSGTPSVTVTTAVGDLVVDSAYRWGTTATPTVGTGQTSRYTPVQAGSDPDYMAGSTKPASTTSTAMSWTFFGAADRWATCGVPLTPAQLTAIPVLTRRRR